MSADALRSVRLSPHELQRGEIEAAYHHPEHTRSDGGRYEHRSAGRLDLTVRKGSGHVVHVRVLPPVPDGTSG